MKSIKGFVAFILAFVFIFGSVLALHMIGRRQANIKAEEKRAMDKRLQEIFREKAMESPVLMADSLNQLIRQVGIKSKQGFKIDGVVSLVLNCENGKCKQQYHQPMTRKK